MRSNAPAIIPPALFETVITDRDLVPRPPSVCPLEWPDRTALSHVSLRMEANLSCNKTGTSEAGPESPQGLAAKGIRRRGSPIVSKKASESGPKLSLPGGYGRNAVPEHYDRGILHSACERPHCRRPKAFRVEFRRPAISPTTLNPACVMARRELQLECPNPQFYPTRKVYKVASLSQYY